MGHACAEKLIREGYTVFGLDINEPEPVDGLYFIRTDLTDPQSVSSAFDKVRSMTGELDCIINMAGMYGLDSLAEISEAEFNRIFQVNLFSVYRVNRTFLPLLSRGGRIVITSSELAPLDPLPFTGIYAITKAAVEKYAYSLRMELQTQGIKVIVIRPGAVNTDMLNASVAALDAFCEKTSLYTANAAKFKGIVDKVEARNIPPEKIADLLWKALRSENPRQVYSINRNPLLLLLNMLPKRLQTRIIVNIIRG